MSAVSGIFAIDKPPGMSSMKAVAAVRRRAGGARTGHAGTLDPLATGVLVIAIGDCTKLLNALMATEKRYQTTIDLSAFTDTDDTEGRRTEVVPGTPGAAAAVPAREAIERMLSERFTGTVMQTPPIFSAMKVDGKRAYAMARKGDAPELKPRPVTIHEVKVTAYGWPMLSLDIHCGKGTYVRSIARELGTALGTGGHCTMIRRTAVGAYAVDEAVRLRELPERITQEWLDSRGPRPARGAR